MADTSATAELLWVPLMAGAIMSPALTAAWVTVPGLRRRRRLLRIAEAWKPPSGCPSRSEAMINDMLEAEIDMLWLQQERATWRRHDPKYAWKIPFYTVTLLVLGLFGYQDVLVFNQLGDGNGLAACLLTVFIWAVPASIVAKRANGRDEFRMLRGNTPRSAEDMAVLRGLHQANRIEAPSYKVFQEWLRPHMQTTSDKKSLSEYAREVEEHRREIHGQMAQAELARQERIRILLSPHTDRESPHDRRNGRWNGNGKTPGHSSGPGSYS